MFDIRKAHVLMDHFFDDEYKVTSSPIIRELHRTLSGSLEQISELEDQNKILWENIQEGSILLNLGASIIQNLTQLRIRDIKKIKALREEISDSEKRNADLQKCIEKDAEGVFSGKVQQLENALIKERANRIISRQKVFQNCKHYCPVCNNIRICVLKDCPAKDFFIDEARKELDAEGAV